MNPSELAEVHAETSQSGWDGFNAFPTSRSSYELAGRFARLLDRCLIEPTAGALADGSMTLEWYAGPRRSLSVSFDGDAVLHFAILDGDFKDCGSETFANVIPQRIQQHIERLCEEKTLKPKP